VLQIMKSLLAEGVAKLVIVTDEPEKYDGVALAPGVTVHHRDELDRIQRELREIKGCTRIIYDQTCATEKRRRRKRGKLADARQARGHQRAGVRRLRRLLACRATA
jgi:indolepyruvate ferredoxin oxidoreductase